ncbi:hypothetical protein J23TS9_17710 [Paenibacillus sp. J23TS9]|nr:hypothetical protein J23TS9_17710 [Paenibacillus sp. J23TS9]
MEILRGFRQIGSLSSMQENAIPFCVRDHLISILSMAHVEYYDFIYFKYNSKLKEKKF